MEESDSARQKAVSEATAAAMRKKELTAGGWLCVCGRTNTDVTGTCVCGTKKRSAAVLNHKKLTEKAELQQEALRKKRKEILFKTTQKADPNKIDILREYRDLLDSGIITKEEFEKKKNEWLQLTW